MSVAIPQKFYKPVAIGAALAFVYFAVLMKLGTDWWNDENYSHGLLVPFIIGFIVWQERERFTEEQSKSALLVGAICVSFSLLALWAGTAGAELFVQRASLLLMLAGIVIYFFGFRIIGIIAVPMLLLALAIPIPQIIFNKIAFPLQLFASKCAVVAMQFFEIPVLRQGNVIELMPLGAKEPKRLAVVEACSGIRSLMTLVTLAVVYAYFTRPKSNSDGPPGGRGTRAYRTFAFWRAVILVASAVPIAILTNAARVSGTGVLAHYYGTKVADGFFHSFSGWVIYVVAAALLFATGWVLDKVGRMWTHKATPRLEAALVPPASGQVPTLNETKGATALREAQS